MFALCMDLILAVHNWIRNREQPNMGQCNLSWKFRSKHLERLVSLGWFQNWEVLGSQQENDRSAHVHDKQRTPVWTQGKQSCHPGTSPSWEAMWLYRKWTSSPVPNFLLVGSVPRDFHWLICPWITWAIPQILPVYFISSTPCLFIVCSVDTFLLLAAKMSPQIHLKSIPDRSDQGPSLASGTSSDCPLAKPWRQEVGLHLEFWHHPSVSPFLISFTFSTFLPKSIQCVMLHMQTLILLGRVILNQKSVND